MILRPATPADFTAIRAMAGSAQHRLWITDEDEAALSAYVTDPHARLFMLDIGADKAAGYALFCELDSRAKSIELRRLALRDTDTGRGRAFVQMLTDYAFEHLGAARVWLDTSLDNLRAQKVYESVGYLREGCLRQHGYIAALQKPIDELIYGILRDEWAARRG